ncbi:MAG: DUF3226 domain-containing protein [Planctomycetota bacterium]
MEGLDAFRFFKFFLEHEGLLQQIEVRNFGGVDELDAYLPALKATPGFSQVRSVGVVRDAEAEMESAFRAVCRALGSADLPVPRAPETASEGAPKVSVYILPDCKRPGMLETLCLDAFGDDAALPCVQAYFACLQQRDAPHPNNLDKSRLQTLLASRPEPTPYIGRAAERRYFNFDHHVFDRLRAFLQGL